MLEQNEGTDPPVVKLQVLLLRHSLTSETLFISVIINASALVAMPSPLGKQTHAAKLR